MILSDASSYLPTVITPYASLGGLHGLIQDAVDRLYYITMGKHGKSLQIGGHKVVHLRHLGDVGQEYQTLHELYDYCKHHKRSKVFYFHNKGELICLWINVGMNK